MAERVFIKPAKPDLKIRIPGHNRYLNAEGEELELTFYWRRIIKDGDAEIVVPPKASSSSKTTSNTTGA